MSISAKSALKALSGGITPAAIARQVMTTNSVTFAEYTTFWLSLQLTTQGACRLVVELVKKYIEVEKMMRKEAAMGATATAGTVKQQKDLDRALWTLALTLQLIELYFALDSQDKPMRSAFAAYDAYRVENKPTTPTQIEADRIISSLNHSSLATEKLDRTNALVLDIAYVNAVESALMGASLGASSRDLSFSVLRENPFIWTRLVAQMTRGGDGSRSVFSEIVKHLRSMPSVIRSQPALMTSLLGNVMALLHMLRESILSFPVADTNLLKAGMSAAHAFVSWPVPYSTQARRVCATIQQELRCPGSGVRSRIFKENPFLTRAGALQVEALGPQGLDWARGHRVVVVVHNPNIPRTQLLRRMISRPLSRGSTFTQEMTSTKEDLLASFFEMVVDSSTMPPAQFRLAVVAALRNRNPADVHEWYLKAMESISARSVDPVKLLDALRAVSPSLANGASLRSGVAQTEPGAAERSGPANAAKLLFASHNDVDSDEDERSDSFDINGASGQLPQHQQPGFALSTLYDATRWSHTAPRIPQVAFEFLEVAPLLDSQIMELQGGPASIGGRRFTVHRAARARAKTGASTVSGGGFGGGSFSSFPDEDFTPPPATQPSGKKMSIGRRLSKRGGNPPKGRPSLAVPGLETFANNPAFDGEGLGWDDIGHHRCPQRYVAYPLDYEEFLRDARSTLPPGMDLKKPLVTKDAEDEEDDRPLASKAPKYVMKRVILGGHDVLHRVLCTYVALLTMEPELCARIDFRFFLVPVARNDLASFIAQRDGWYRKHVFVPFHGPLFTASEIRQESMEGMGGLASSELVNGGHHGGSFSSLPSDRAGDKGAGPSPRVHRIFSDFMGGGLADHPSISGVMKKEADTNAKHASGWSTMADSQPEAPAEAAWNPLFRGGDSDADSEVGLGGSGAGDDGDEGTPRSGTPTRDTPPRRGPNAATAALTASRGHRLDATPMKLLRHLLSDYVRGADSNVVPVLVYDCECWESPDAIEVDRAPDVTVPFCVRVELGLGAAAADFAATEDFATNFIGESTQEGLGADYSLDEILCDKAFVKSAIKVATPDLTVTLHRMGVDGTLQAETTRDALELADSTYMSLTIAKVPVYTYPSSTSKSMVTLDSINPSGCSANPTFPWLEVQAVATRPALVELVKKKDKKPRDVDLIKESLRLDARTHHVGQVDVRASQSSRLPFMIAVDGRPFGPFYRVRIRTCTALSSSGGMSVKGKSPKVVFPVMSFAPIETANGGAL